MKPIPEMNAAELTENMHRLKRMIRFLGRLIQVPEENVIERASGLAICPHCGLEYYDHPSIGKDLVLHIDCAGRVWKL